MENIHVYGNSDNLPDSADSRKRFIINRMTMTVLKTAEDSYDRFVTAVTKNVIKAVDLYGYPYYYRRDDGIRILSSYSTNAAGESRLEKLDKIEKYVFRNGCCISVPGRLVWDGGLKQYLKQDNTINPQWKNGQGASLSIRQIKRLKIVSI